MRGRAQVDGGPRHLAALTRGTQDKVLVPPVLWSKVFKLAGLRDVPSLLAQGLAQPLVQEPPTNRWVSSSVVLYSLYFVLPVSALLHTS